MLRLPRGATALLPLLLVLPLPGCSHGEPPAPDVSPSIALPESPAPIAPAASAAPRASSGGAAPASASASPTPSAVASASSADPSLLPQTRDVPQETGPAFQARVAALWDAIVSGDAEAALPAFFPVGAYKQVKDVPDPASDWKHRLVAAYTHDIVALHARLGDQAAEAKLVGLEIPPGHARWVEPGEEYNKLGYYRVFGSRLRYEVNGEGRSFEVKSLISWRGEWYVVHLSAIK